MSASTPLGGRSYPPDAAGTQLANGLVLSGDDAPAFERAGYDVMPMHVQCSARISRGEDTPRVGWGYVTIAIERHGRSLETLEQLTGAETLRPATGIYKGATSRVAVGWLHAGLVESTHAALVEHLPGFECFAVMTPRD